ncbi:MAG: response regulator [Ignavibacteriaceae bacterium]|jgi:two-component system alkaline phosphatase synthesis response regulator PhoP
MEKILIIDDDETTLIYLSMLFAENDFYVISADNVKEGIEKALQEKPYIIILGMSGGSEVMIMRKLQINKNIKSIPIIITGDVLLFKRYFELNEQFPMLKDYIEKPINSESLFRKVKELLNHKFQ